jgi:UDP-glucose 4-epimerase
MRNVLVTGASGFIGRAMCSRLTTSEVPVVAAVRRHITDIPAEVRQVVTGEIHGATAWDAALEDVSSVIHLAGRAHVTHYDSPEKCRRVNVDGTLALAHRAAAVGIERFVFVSSIKVNGEGRATPYSSMDHAAPQGAYARSKWEAEQSLRQIERETGMAVVIVRPPLVYGPGVRANFLSLMRIIHTGVPLPFGTIDNRRSLLFLDNLTDALAQCLEHPAARGETFLVSDGEDISTAELIRRLATAMGIRPTFLPVPSAMLRVAARVVGRSEMVERLTTSLTIDGRAIRTQLNWTPPVSLQQGLGLTVADYLESHGR